jgi:hypothetical protein
MAGVLKRIKDIAGSTDNKNRDHSGIDRQNRLDILAGDNCED